MSRDAISAVPQLRAVKIDPLLPERRSPPGDSRRRADRAPAPLRTRRALAALGATALAVGIGAVFVAATGGDEPTSDSVAVTTLASPSIDAVTTTAAPVATAPSIDAPGSLWWVVNPSRPIPADYVPADLTTPDVPLRPGATATQLAAATAAAFESMVAEAGAAGYELQLTSGYRSYGEQQQLYDRFVQDFGEEVAAERVALPGTSEHQTGLAADVGLVGLPDDQAFGNTQASVWVANNAHRFGFILRYPPDKADITGYANEPWHLRYVGVELAGQLFASGLTMEEHFGLVPASQPQAG
jgi:D-alanyl-D-alanine carboxypeptidase